MTELDTTSIVGARLKKARESKNLSIEEVAIKTKIHRNVLVDLEADKLRKRLNDIYVRSFLKTYSDFLELNTPEILDEYFSVHTSRQPQSAHMRVDLQKLTSGWTDNIQKVGKAVFALTVTCLVLYLAFVMSIKAVKTISSVFGNIKPAAKTKSVKADKNLVSEKKTDKKTSEKSYNSTERKDGIFPIKNTQPLLLKITANKDCWMQIKVDEKTLFQGVLKTGRSEKWQASKNFEIWVGNAGGIALSLNNNTLPSLGKSGEVKKGIIISHTGIKK